MATGKKRGSHLESIQTPDLKTLQNSNELKASSLVTYYAHLIVECSAKLLELSNYLCVDAYFAKEKFINEVHKMGLQVVTRLRQDADLYYLHEGEPTGRRGRPKVYDGKVKVKNIDKKRFELASLHDYHRIYSCILWRKSLKKKLKVAYVEKVNKEGKVIAYRLFCSTDLELSASKIVSYYRLRFQIEFLFRDTKQHAGLNEFECRDEQKIDHHTNMSLSSVNIAQLEQVHLLGRDLAAGFSMSDVKMAHWHLLLSEHIFSIFELDQSLLQKEAKREELLNFGLKRAKSPLKVPEAA